MNQVYHLFLAEPGKRPGFARVLWKALCLVTILLSGASMATAQQQLVVSTDTISVVIQSKATAAVSFSITNAGDAPLVIDSYMERDPYGAGKAVVFTKANYANWLLPANQDRIAPHVWLTRDETKSLFNAKSEVASEGSSPEGTSWALGTVNQVSAEDFTNFNTMHGNDPQSLVGDTATLKIDFANGTASKYYSVYMQQWSGGKTGGGFTYIRREMLPYYSLTAPFTGEIAAGSGKTVNVLISDAGLESGIHYGHVDIVSNDPIQPVTTVVVKLEVLPAAQIVVSESTISVAMNNADGPVERVFTLSNHGSSTLNWSGTTASNSQGMCASFSALSGSIEPGASAEYTITFGVCNEGTYQWPFVITSNDPDRPKVTLQLSTAVDGSATLDYTAPVFTETYAGVSSTGTLMLHSTGTADLHITDISSDNPVFSPTRKTFTVKPGTSVSVPMKFIPKSAGSHVGELLIVSDAAEDSLYVSISATSIGAPVLSIAQTVFNFDLSQGESTKDSLTIFNSGTSDLIWDFSVAGVVSSGGSFFEKKNYADVSLSQNRDRLTPNVELTRGNNGGVYNYLSEPILYALESAKDNVPSKYQSNFRSAVNTGASDLPGQILSIYIPSEDRYFDLHIDSWTCCEDGGGLSYTRYEVFKWIGPEYKYNPELDVFFEKPENVNINLPQYRDSLTANVSLARNMFNNMVNYNSSVQIGYAMGSAQYLSKEDYVNYFPSAVSNASDLPGKTVSIYIPSEERFFDLDFISWTADNYSTYSPGGYSYVRREVLPTSTGAGLTDYAVINVNANMPAGTYSGSVTVESNDPLLPSAVVPITITTTGTPDISETDQSHDFGSSVQGVSKTFDLNIRSTGSDVLDITAAAIDNAGFEVSSEGFSMAAGASYKLPVTVNSSVSGPITAILTLTTNDPDHSEFTIQITGEILDKPVFAMTEVVFYDTLQYGSSSLQYLTIENNGLGQMEWTVPYDVFFEKENFALPTEASSQDRITDHVWLTRANERGLFNILEADEYTRVSQTFEWGNGPSTYESTEYSYFTDFWDGGDLRDGATVSIHMIADDLYYDFHFTNWTSGDDGGGGGFAYERRKGVKWLGMEFMEGVVEAGESVEVPLNFSALNTTAGDHEFTYRIATNDPNNPEQLVTFKLHVDGEPEIEVGLDPVDLGSFPIGISHTPETGIEINNIGGADLEITLSSDNEAFTFESASFVIRGGSSRFVYPTFTPEAELAYEGTITITSNDADESVINLAVSAAGFYGPELIVSADTIAVTMISGGLVKKPITLSNTGGTNLEWSFWAGFFEMDELTDYKLEANQLRLSDKVSITRNGSNGPFNIKESSSYMYYPTSIKWALGYSKNLLPNNYLSDWYTVSYGIGYDFNNLPGEVVSLYLVEEDRYFDFLFTKYNYYGVLAFYYAEAGGISPNAGEILPGDEEIVQLSVSADGLDAGMHYQEYTIMHNALAQSKKVVAKITVLGAPALSVAEEALAFGVSPIGDESYQEITITNTGSSSGVISLSSDHPAFTVGAEDIRIKANETKTVEVVFNPSSSGDFSGIITITTDDAVNPTFEVGVSGSGATAATITLAKPSLKASLFFGETITRSVTISNSGDFDLNWSLGVYGEEISFLKPDYADYKLEEFQDRIADHLWITRQNERGIFNAALETQFNRSSYESPKGTEWLGDGPGSGPAIRVEANDYGRWRDVAYPPDEQPGKTFSMHDIKSDQFYDISWDSWTSDGNGGGFSYRRKVAFGPEYNAVSFSDTDGVIAPGKSATVLITFNPNSTFNGDFELPLAILSNDPVNRVVKAPVSLSVKGIIVDRFLDDLQLNEGFESLSIDVSDVFADAQGDVLSLSVSNSNESAIAADILDGNLVLTETGYGQSSIVITASDATGNTATEKFEINVNANPVAIPLADVELTRVSEILTLDIASNFEDPEGQELVYAMTNGSDAVVEVSLSGTVLTIGQLTVGTSVISLTATDPLGGSITDKFTVNVSLLEQEITFDTTYVKVYGDEAFELVASASSGLEVSFSSSDESIVAISGTSATVTGAGSVTINAVQTGDEDIYDAAATVQQVMTIGKAMLELTVDDAEMTYGAEEPVYTLSYAGFVNGDDLAAIDTPCSGAMSSTEVLDAGGHVLLANEDAQDNNYEFTYVSGALTVLQADLLITADDASKVYGEENPVLTMSYLGFVKEEDATVLSSPAMVVTAATTESSVGEYAITVSGAAATNYLISYTDGLLIVGSKGLTVRANDQTKVYGAVDPELDYVITEGNLVGEDALSGSLEREAGENVGLYPINQGTLSAGSNYELQFESAALSIGQASIGVTADAKSKVYGAADPELTYSITTGELIGADALSGALTRGAGEHAGVYQIGLGTVSAGANYDVQYQSAEFIIDQAPLTVTADARSKVYGESDPALTYSITEGVLIGEDVLSGVLTRESGEDVGVYAIGLGSVSAGANYDVQYQGAELTVGKASLTVTAHDVVITEGDLIPVLAMTYSGFVNGDTKAALQKEPVASTTATPSSLPGEYPIVLTAEEDRNYTFVLINGVLTIEAGEPILGVDKAGLIEVYPNPAMNFVMVKTTESKPLELYDAVGHLLRSGVTNQQMEVGELPAGIYLIKVEGQVFRLIKK